MNKVSTKNQTNHPETLIKQSITKLQNTFFNNKKMKITIKDFKKLLENVLLKDGKMEYALYEYQLEDLLDDFKESLLEDNDDFLFAITTHKNYGTQHEDTAMVLIEPSGTVHINELARDKLKAVWKGAYEGNMKKIIPGFAKQLYEGEIPVNGVKTALRT